LAWAGQILADHAESPAIVVSHAYLYSDGTRYDLQGRACQFSGDCVNAPATGPTPQCWNPVCYLSDGSDGETVWKSLVLPHSNVLFVFSGHVANPAPNDAARLSSVCPDGTVCHQLLADYQADGATGGDGYFRLVRLWSDGRVEVRTFSPYVDAARAFMTDERNQFDLQIPASGPQQTQPPDGRPSACLWSTVVLQDLDTPSSSRPGGMHMRSMRPVRSLFLFGMLLGGFSACAPALLMNTPVSKRADGWAITLSQVKSGPDEYIGEGGVRVTSEADETLIWTLVTIKNESAEEQTFAYDTCALDGKTVSRKPVVIGRPAEPEAEVNAAADRSEAIPAGQDRARQLIYAFPKDERPARMRCDKITLPVPGPR
jgi:hypothetical protein